MVSHSVLSSPLSGSCLILWLVSLVDMSNLWHKGIIWVGIGQQGGDGEQHLGDGECWGPLILEDVQADGSIGVDIWMVDSSGEVDLGWLEWVIGWEMNVQEKDSSGVRGIIWAHNGGLPMVLILLIEWSGRAVGGWIFTKIDEFLLNSLKS